jgi:hypothetical protein
MTLTYLGEQFRTEVQRSFSLLNLRKGRRPIEIEKARYTPRVTHRLNHFMVKLKHSDEVLIPCWIDPEIQRFVKDCMAHAKENDLPLRGRYAYLTMDNKPILKGKTQRLAGWHLDGLQGEEVPFKLPTCYELTWTNKIPMQITDQGFEVNGLNFSQHNVFDSLAEQVYDESVRTLKANTLYLMNAYQLHRGTPASADTNDRLFLRLYISELPITSSKMSINELIEYPYTVHSTTGNIPEGLVTWVPEAEDALVELKQ